MFNYLVLSLSKDRRFSHFFAKTVVCYIFIVIIFNFGVLFSFFGVCIYVAKFFFKQYSCKINKYLNT